MALLYGEVISEMKTRNSIGSVIFDIINYLILIIFTLVIIFPFIYMFSVSISDPVAVGMMRVRFLPIGFQLNAYRTVFSDPNIMRAYYNSIVYATVGTIVTLFFNCLAAYPLSRPNFKGKYFFVIVFTITMFFSGGMIPNYLNMRNLGLLNTMWAIVFPAVGMWNIILIRTNFQQLPESLIESAYIDGANDWYILFKIVLPLSKAILATVAIFASVSYWNNYFGPLLYLSSADKAPLTIILRRLLITREVFTSGEQAAQAADIVGADRGIAAQGIYLSLRTATIFATIGPIVLVYPFAQKYFVKGVLIGSIKG